MAGVRTFVLAGVGIVAALMAANAADLPPVSQVAAPPVEGFGGGWYLRGNIGFSNQSVGSRSNPQDSTTTSFRYLDKGFDAAPLLGIGVGYQANPWLRADLSGESRGSANFHGF
jgi:opacity protein-like surface antigen